MTSCMVFGTISLRSLRLNGIDLGMVLSALNAENILKKYLLTLTTKSMV